MGDNQYNLQINDFPSPGVHYKRKVLSLSFDNPHEQTRFAVSPPRTIREIHLTKAMDEVSTTFAQYASSGDLLARVLLSSELIANGSVVHNLHLVLKNALISSYKVTGSNSGEDKPVDNITFNFTEYTFKDIAIQPPDGPPEAEHLNWDMPSGREAS